MDVHFGPGEVTVVGILLTAVVGALVATFRLLMASKEAQLGDAKTAAENYRSIAADAVRMMEAAVARQRQAEGLPAQTKLAAVVPEHSSPTTPAQAATADQATMRAAVTAAALHLGVPPRAEAPSEPMPPPPGLITKADAVEAILAVPPPGGQEAPPQREPGKESGG